MDAEPSASSEKWWEQTHELDIGTDDFIGEYADLFKKGESNVPDLTFTFHGGEWQVGQSTILFGKDNTRKEDVARTLAWLNENYPNGAPPKETTEVPTDPKAAFQAFLKEVAATKLDLPEGVPPDAIRQ